MGEVTFAKQFLSTLESRTVKLPSDYVSDPKSLPAQPAYIIPKTSKPFPSRSQRSAKDQHTRPAPSSSASAQGQTLSIALAPLRQTSGIPSALEIPLQASEAPRKSIFDLKQQLGRQTGYAPDKLRILWHKKPVGDTKTVAEVVGEAVGQGRVEMNVMYIGTPTLTPDPNGGGAPAERVQSKEGSRAENMDVDEIPVAQGSSGRAVLETEAFWKDLRGFVEQRLRDADVAEKVVGIWRGSTESIP